MSLDACFPQHNSCAFLMLPLPSYPRYCLAIPALVKEGHVEPALQAFDEMLARDTIPSWTA